MAPAGQRDGVPDVPRDDPHAGQPAKGSEVRVVRCKTHGIAYDSEREVCPECAKGALPERRTGVI